MFNHLTNKYIFLDIDGVMNCQSDIKIKRIEGVKDRLDYHFCENAWNNLADICKKTGAKIVLSSSWRYGFLKDDNGCMICFDDKEKYSARLLAYFKEHHIPFIDTTTFRNAERGQQILDYIVENLNGLTDEWIVIDDEKFDFERILPMENVFITNMETGLTQEICSRILEHWSK